MDDEDIACETCGGEAVESRQVPWDLNIQHDGRPLCADCHNNEIRKAEDEKYYEERREEKRQKRNDEQTGWSHRSQDSGPSTLGKFNR